MALTRHLDNIYWHALVGPHAQYGVGPKGARRYARGYAPLIGFANPVRPDFDALAPHCKPGEYFYCSGWSGRVPSGWQLDDESLVRKMIWEKEMLPSDEGDDATRLQPYHWVQALELAMLTRPGPFTTKSLELGDYFGYFERGRLIAMAGERLLSGGFHEIAGVCTHPDYRGQGLARQLVLKLIRRQLARKETPFVQVYVAYETARKFYQKLGFREYHDAILRVMTRQ